jgi:hypothetical protein
VVVAVFASTFGLCLVLAAMVLQSVKGEGTRASVRSERDATVPRDDTGQDMGVTRGDIRIEHELPQRLAPNGEPTDSFQVEAVSTSRVSVPVVFSAREKRASGPVTLRQAPNESIEPAPLPHIVRGTRSSNDGFDELVLPHP